MYRARDRVEQAAWLKRLDAAANELGLDPDTRSVAVDLYLSTIPDSDRSKPTGIAASLYAATLITGHERPQTAVADAVGVSRLVVQNNWKGVLEAAGFEAPSW